VLVPDVAQLKLFAVAKPAESKRRNLLQQDFARICCKVERSTGLLNEAYNLAGGGRDQPVELRAIEHARWEWRGWSTKSSDSSSAYGS
jgi:hypothetical protein